MESSRRAVEVYKRTRLVEQASANDDQVAPVYLLEEICEIIRSSPTDLVRETLDYTIKRLDHKSPRVKQKILRLLKYTCGKSGPEYKREVQRRSAAIRQLFHYRGQEDNLRGDALNKAVRDMAHEAIAAIFASDEKNSASDDLSKRIQGFGSSNYDPQMEGKKTILDEVVSFGSASIKQGLSMISGYSGSTPNNVNKRNGSGSYRGPSLRKSLTSERETYERHAGIGAEEPRGYIEASDRRVSRPMTYEQEADPHVHSSKADDNTEREVIEEEKVLESITNTGGVRLQPTRESLQMFLSTALKLDPINLGHALESKLQAHAWQVRFKALCVLEAMLRQKEEVFFGKIADFFLEDFGAISDCLQFPQTTLKDKAKKVLDLLGAGSGKVSSAEKTCGTESAPTINMPDLIDTAGDSDDIINGVNIINNAHQGPQLTLQTSSPCNDLLDGSFLTTGAGQSVTPTNDLLLGDNLLPEASKDAAVSSNDPFAGLSFHATEEANMESSMGNLFSGLSIDNQNPLVSSSNQQLGKGEDSPTKTPDFGQHGSPFATTSDSLVDALKIPSTGGSSVSVGNHGNLSDLLKTPAQAPLMSNSQMMFMNPQMMPMNPSPAFTGGSSSLPFLPNMAMPVPFVPGAMGGIGQVPSAFAQQQLIANLASLPRYGFGPNMAASTNFQGTNRITGPSFSDGFDFSSDPARYASTVEITKKEDTKAFDFISDHVVAARGPKRGS